MCTVVAVSHTHASLFAGHIVQHHHPYSLAKGSREGDEGLNSLARAAIANDRELLLAAGPARYVKGFFLFSFSYFLLYFLFVCCYPPLPYTPFPIYIGRKL